METWKEVKKDVNDLYIKPSITMDHSKWREMIRANWSSSDTDSDSDIDSDK